MGDIFYILYTISNFASFPLLFSSLPLSFSIFFLQFSSSSHCSQSNFY
ncbi:hypothetical protein AtEden1_Chr1g0041871 [Arabidopsis thaliana]